MEYAITALVLLGILQLGYWLIVRPYLLEKICFHVENLLFDLEIFARDKGPGGSYRILRSIGEVILNQSEELDLASMLKGFKTVEVRLRVEKTLQREHEAFGEFHDRLARQTTAAVLINSPLIIVYVIAVLLWEILNDQNKGQRRMTRASLGAVYAHA